MILNNILCFIDSAVGDYNEEALFEIIFSFYSDEEIADAKATLSGLLSLENKLRRDPNKRKKDLCDRFELYNKYTSSIDIDSKELFVCDSYKKMPPSGFDTIAPTMAHLLKEVKELREESVTFYNNMSETTRDIKKAQLDHGILDGLYRDVKQSSEDIKIIKNSLKSLTRIALDSEVRRTSIFSDVLPRESIAEDVTNTCVNFLEDFVSDLRFNETPSAPELSQPTAVIPPSPAPPPGFNINQDKQLYSSVVVNSPPVNKPTKNTSQQKKLPTIVFKASNPRGRSKSQTTDDEGYTQVRSRKQRRNTTGTKKTFDSVSFKSSTRYVDLYVGHCALDTTPEMISDYLASELSITAKKCTEIPTKVPYSMAFKITVNIADRDKLFNPESWPENVVCHKYFSPRER